MKTSSMKVEAITVADIGADPAPGAVGKVVILAIGREEASGVMAFADEADVVG